jgi:hypothetical protein
MLTIQIKSPTTAAIHYLNCWLKKKMITSILEREINWAANLFDLPFDNLSVRIAFLQTVVRLSLEKCSWGHVYALVTLVSCTYKNQVKKNQQLQQHQETKICSISSTSLRLRILTKAT